MENRTSGRFFLPIAGVFVLCSILIEGVRSPLAGWNLDYRVLLAGNLILFGATALSLYLYIRAFRSPRIHAVIRVAYGSMIIKMFGCMVAVMAYLWLAGPTANKRGVIACFGLYVIYTFLEVNVLMRLNKKPSPNA